MNIVPTTAQDNGSIAKELLYCWHFKRLRIAFITASPQLQFDYPILGQLDGSSALNDAKYDYDDRDNQQNVNETAYGVGGN